MGLPSSSQPEYPPGLISSVVMGRQIPITRPWIGEAEVEAARRPLMSGWVTQGPEVAAFEREFASYVGARHACAVSNCTTALHLALLAVGVRPGNEVVTVSHSFIATSNSIRYCGAIPVFVDIQPGTFNIDPTLVERVVTRRTRAILCVHQLGMACDLGSLLPIAARHSLPLIEDAACAIGSEIRRGDEWQKIGRPHGDIACFSFHPRKVITTGDGGMLTTDREDWDRQFRLWRQHGMSVPDSVRHESPRVIFESYPVVGYNYRMTDLQAAVGREQLKRLPEIVRRRRELARNYEILLGRVPGLRLPEEAPWARSNWQSYCVRLPRGRNQRTVMQSMLDGGVATRRGVMCAHRQGAYAQEPWSCGSGVAGCECPGEHCERLWESEVAEDHCIMLPLYPQMTDAEQEQVAEALRSACH
jgi:dTDP-4-amino-4,6-dideoxygalactose transaminase